MDGQRQAEGMKRVDRGGRQIGFPVLGFPVLDLPVHDVTQKAPLKAIMSQIRVKGESIRKSPNTVPGTQRLLNREAGALLHPAHAILPTSVWRNGQND